jgi:hypothetical protein
MSWFIAIALKRTVYRYMPDIWAAVGGNPDDIKFELSFSIRGTMDAGPIDFNAIVSVGQCTSSTQFTHSLKAPGFNLEPIR